MLTVKQLLSLFEPDSDLQINLVREVNSTLFIPYPHFMLEWKGYDAYLSAPVHGLNVEEHEAEGKTIPLLIIESR